MIKGTLRDPQKDSYKINVNMITTLPPTVPAVTPEIKSWFLRLLSLVLDASRLVSSPLGLWGARWIVRFDWVVCGEKWAEKRFDWLNETERSASSWLHRQQRQSRGPANRAKLTFSRPSISVSNYYLLKRNSWCLHITDITALHSGIDFYIYCCWL